MITRLELTNFTAFTDLAIDFSPKINVIIGENGNGKTQLLKAVYALCTGGVLQSTAEGNGLAKSLTRKLVRLLMPLDNKLGTMRRPGVRGNAQLKACFSLGEEISLAFNGSADVATVNTNVAYANYRAEPIFVPTKEVLSLVRGMTDANHDQRTVELIFDDGYLDLAQMLLREGVDDPESKVNLDPRFDSIVPMLANLIGGRYQLENGGFCFQSGTYIEKLGKSSSETKAPQTFKKATTRFVPEKSVMISSGMTAEGFRKVGMLQRLLINGTLNPGVSGPLLWDEPESNLNPKLMKLLVEILLELSRNGQQVILATHDYVLLKWLDLLMDRSKGDHVRFHCLNRNQSTNNIQSESLDDYSIIGRSAISNTFAELYDADVDRALGDL
ncbi:AAA family ATPase [Pseudomonas sp. 1912-s]|uniref:AAA family ATPase n=1 Tax=Pseudomonas sp. 1912-s TaxID=3033802 RepID=UPI0023DFC63B|nr:AAA family ATPase [Pseudomonas sp. 1912-s]MDF3201944.1 AAA family ATPase [Pseudomonas sp. 1912-s]